MSAAMTSGRVPSTFDSMSDLSFLPFRYPLFKDLYLARQGFQTLFVENYIVFYIVDDTAKQVIIHRVIYGKRNYRERFLED